MNDLDIERHRRANLLLLLCAHQAAINDNWSESRILFLRAIRQGLRLRSLIRGKPAPILSLDAMQLFAEFLKDDCAETSTANVDSLERLQ
jgi:hypothetical protein